MTPSLVHAGGVDDVVKARQLQRDAGKALGEEDWATANGYLLEAVELRPTHPALRYTLASVQALNGDKAASLASLERLVELGASYDPTLEAEFKPWVGDPTFDALVLALKANGEPRRLGEVALTVPEIKTAEGLVYDPSSGDLYVGTVRRGEVFRVAPSGEVHPLYTPGSLPGSVLGLGIDSVNHRLWVTRSVLPESEGASPETRGRAVLLGFDLQDVNSSPRVLTPPGQGPVTLGDLAVSPSGDVVVSDPVSGLIYHLDAGAESLQVLVPAGQLLSPQGLVFDGGQVVVADYALGILSIRLSDGQVTPVKCRSATSLLGIDGMVKVGRNILAIQNGTTPVRVVLLQRNWRGTIREVEVLEVAHPDWVEPTVATSMKDDVLYVGNGVWGEFRDGQWPPDGELPPLKILHIKGEDLP